MAALTVWRFQDPAHAQEALGVLQDLQKRNLVAVADAASITWAADAKAPRIRQAINTTATGAIGGAFWGFLLGMLFLMPALGAVIGAATGAVGGALTDIGINDDFIKEMRAKVVPGTSALVLLADASAPDKVSEAVAYLQPEFITSNLTREQELTLRDYFQN